MRKLEEPGGVEMFVFARGTNGVGERGGWHYRVQGEWCRGLRGMAGERYDGLDAPLMWHTDRGEKVTKVLLSVSGKQRAGFFD